MRITQPVASGLFFLIFGAAFFWLAQDLPMGTAADMGVGYTPRMLAVGCTIVGAVLLAAAKLAREPAEPVTASLAPLVLVTVMVAGFAALLPWIGLPAAVIASVLPAAFAGEAFRWPLLLAMAAGLAALTTALFAWGLKLQIPVLPAFL